MNKFSALKKGLVDSDKSEQSNASCLHLAWVINAEIDLPLPIHIAAPLLVPTWIAPQGVAESALCRFKHGPTRSSGHITQLKVGYSQQPAGGICDPSGGWNSRMRLAILAHSKIVRDCCGKWVACSTETNRIERQHAPERVVAGEEIVTTISALENMFGVGGILR